MDDNGKFCFLGWYCFYEREVGVEWEVSDPFSGAGRMCLGLPVDSTLEQASLQGALGRVTVLPPTPPLPPGQCGFVT